jgi:hypothetical protein
MALAGKMCRRVQQRLVQALNRHSGDPSGNIHHQTALE